MKVRIWGARGSIPSPLHPEEVRAKIRQIILHLPDIDTTDAAAVDAYLEQLSPLEYGTAGGNTTCIEIQAGPETIIIDAGSGLRELGQELMKGPCGRGEGTIHLLFSHAHWDHIQGFPFFMPAFVPGNRLFIYHVHDLKSALTGQQLPLTFPVPLSYMRASLEFIPLTPQQPFFIGGVEINTIETVHPGKAYAYRLADEHGIFVFASDAEYKQLEEDSLRPYLNFYKGADVLIFDAQFTLEEVWQKKIDWGHSSALIGADIARMAGVKKLVLFHHDPTYSDAQLLDILQRTIDYQTQDAAHPPCEVAIAYEGLTFDLTPLGMVSLQTLAGGEEAVLTPSGSFDELVVASLEEQVQQFEETGWPPYLVIDLSQTETLTTAGLKALISLRKERARTVIALTNLSPNVQQVIELAGFADLFAIYPTVEAAREVLQLMASLNLPGQLLQNHYRLESRLSDSWQGTVFKATDTQLNQTVAISVLAPFLGEKTIAEFMRQAQQIMSLDHANIVRVFDVRQEQGLTYSVAEFSEPYTLHDLLAEASGQPLAAEQARAISLSIVNALEYAHSRGVLHYNLTPRHILLAPDLKLSNFGLGSMGGGRPLLELPLVLFETAYLAPEQILGQTPDARTDLYALGVVMYELFTGQPPFTGSDQEIMPAHLQQSPRPPRELNPQLSRSLEYLILKLLAKDPTERYATAHQIGQILNNLIVSVEDNAGVPAFLRADPKPLFNREVELEQLVKLWQRVRNSGAAHLLAIQGEMGIGKSKLVAEFLSRYVVQPGFSAVMGRSDEFGTPYTPYAEILAAIFNEGLVDPQTVADQAESLIRRIPGLASVLGPHQAAAASEASLSSQSSQWRFFEACQLLLAKLGPAVIFLEDAAFLDEASIALTRFLIRRSRLPLLIVAAGRSDETGSGWVDAFQLDKKDILTLSPLPTEALKAYLVSLMGGRVSEEVVNTVEKRSHGNPYFVEEITRHLIEQGAFRQNEQGEWYYKPDKGTGALLPPTLVEVFTQRVEKLTESSQLRDLSASARQALAMAAMIGPEFDFETWVAVLRGQSQENLALDTLDEALGLRLLRQAGGDHYVFEPVDLADVLATSLPGPYQRHLHQQIAEALSQGEENPVVISHHYAEAGLVEQAARYLELAGAKAMSAHAINEAISYYNRALALAASQSSYEALGNLYRQKGASTEATQAFQQGLNLARAAGDIAGQAQILNDLAIIYWLYDHYHEAYQAAAEVLNLAGVSEIERATAQSHLGMICWMIGELDEAEKWCQKAVEILVRGSDQSRLADAYNRLGLVYASKTRLNEAEEVFMRSLEIRRELDDYWGQAYCLNNLGKVALEEGDFDQATLAFMAAQELFEEIDSPDGLLFVYTNQGRLFLRRQQAAKALQILRKALDQAKKLSKPTAYALGDVYLLLAEGCLQRHDLSHARAATHEASKLVEAAGNREYIALAQTTLARIRAMEGDAQTAETLYQKALALFEQVGSPAGRIRTQLHYAQLLRAQDQLEAAADLEQAARAEAERLGLYLQVQGD